MLSRKRCRGTLQDYNKGEISECQSKLWTNRNVSSWCLNGTREETVQRDDGRMFHARGAATGKARSPRGGRSLHPQKRQALLLWTTVDDGVFPRRLSDECSLRGMPVLIR